MAWFTSFLRRKEQVKIQSLVHANNTIVHNQESIHCSSCRIMDGNKADDVIIPMLQRQWDSVIQSSLAQSQNLPDYLEQYLNSILQNVETLRVNDECAFPSFVSISFLHCAPMLQQICVKSVLSNAFTRSSSAQRALSYLFKLLDRAVQSSHSIDTLLSHRAISVFYAMLDAFQQSLPSSDMTIHSDRDNMEITISDWMVSIVSILRKMLDPGSLWDVRLRTHTFRSTVFNWVRADADFHSVDHLGLDTLVLLMHYLVKTLRYLSNLQLALAVPLARHQRQLRREILHLLGTLVLLHDFDRDAFSVAHSIPELLCMLGLPRFLMEEGRKGKETLYLKEPRKLGYMSRAELKLVLQDEFAAQYLTIAILLLLICQGSAYMEEFHLNHGRDSVKDIIEWVSQFHDVLTNLQEDEPDDTYSDILPEGFSSAETAEPLLFLHRLASFHQHEAPSLDQLRADNANLLGSLVHTRLIVPCPMASRELKVLFNMLIYFSHAKPHQSSFLRNTLVNLLEQAENSNRTETAIASESLVKWYILDMLVQLSFPHDRTSSNGHHASHRNTFHSATSLQLSESTWIYDADIYARLCDPELSVYAIGYLCQIIAFKQNIDKEIHTLLKFCELNLGTCHVLRGLSVLLLFRPQEMTRALLSCRFLHRIRMMDKEHQMDLSLFIYVLTRENVAMLKSIYDDNDTFDRYQFMVTWIMSEENRGEDAADQSQLFVLPLWYHHMKMLLAALRDDSPADSWSSRSSTVSVTRSIMAIHNQQTLLSCLDVHRQLIVAATAMDDPYRPKVTRRHLNYVLLLMKEFTQTMQSLLLVSTDILSYWVTCLDHPALNGEKIDLLVHLLTCFIRDREMAKSTLTPLLMPMTFPIPLAWLRFMSCDGLSLSSTSDYIITYATPLYHTLRLLPHFASTSISIGHHSDPQSIPSIEILTEILLSCRKHTQSLVCLVKADFVAWSLQQLKSKSLQEHPEIHQLLLALLEEILHFHASHDAIDQIVDCIESSTITDTAFVLSLTSLLTRRRRHGGGCSPSSLHTVKSVFCFSEKSVIRVEEVDRHRLNLQQQWSFATWIYFDAEKMLSDGQQPSELLLISFRNKNQNAYSLYLRRGYLHMRCHVNNKDIDIMMARIQLISQQWYHVVVTFDNMLHLYINGSQQDSIVMDVIANAMPNMRQHDEPYSTVYIGGDFQDDRHFRGQMTCLYVFDQAIPANLVSYLYLLSPSYAGLFSEDDGQDHERREDDAAENNSAIRNDHDENERELSGLSLADGDGKQKEGSKNAKDANRIFSFSEHEEQKSTLLHRFFYSDRHPLRSRDKPIVPTSTSSSLSSADAMWRKQRRRSLREHLVLCYSPSAVSQTTTLINLAYSPSGSVTLDAWMDHVIPIRRTAIDDYRHILPELQFKQLMCYIHVMMQHPSLTDSIMNYLIVRLIDALRNDGVYQLVMKHRFIPLLAMTLFKLYGPIHLPSYFMQMQKLLLILSDPNANEREDARYVAHQSFLFNFELQKTLPMHRRIDLLYRISRWVIHHRDVAWMYCKEHFGVKFLLDALRLYFASLPGERGDRKTQRRCRRPIYSLIVHYLRQDCQVRDIQALVNATLLLQKDGDDEQFTSNILYVLTQLYVFATRELQWQSLNCYYEIITVEFFFHLFTHAQSMHLIEKTLHFLYVLLASKEAPTHYKATLRQKLPAMLDVMLEQKEGKTPVFRMTHGSYSILLQLAMENDSLLSIASTKNKRLQKGSRDHPNRQSNHSGPLVVVNYVAMDFILRTGQSGKSVVWDRIMKELSLCMEKKVLKLDELVRLCYSKIPIDQMGHFQQALQQSSNVTDKNDKATTAEHHHDRLEYYVEHILPTLQAVAKETNEEKEMASTLALSVQRASNDDEQQPRRFFGRYSTNPLDEEICRLIEVETLSKYEYRQVLSSYMKEQQKPQDRPRNEETAADNVLQHDDRGSLNHRHAPQQQSRQVYRVDTFSNGCGMRRRLLTEPMRDYKTAADFQRRHRLSLHPPVEKGHLHGHANSDLSPPVMDSFDQNIVSYLRRYSDQSVNHKDPTLPEDASSENLLLSSASTPSLLLNSSESAPHPQRSRAPSFVAQAIQEKKQFQQHEFFAQRHAVFECELVMDVATVSGLLEIRSESREFVFFADEHKNNMDALREMNIQVDDVMCRRWSLDHISFALRRRRLMKQCAVELFFHHHPQSASVLLDFRQVRYLVSFAQQLNEHRQGIFDPHKSPMELFRKLAPLLTTRWQRREISNFEYLMALNLIAGRSMHDLTQYPVFPWVLREEAMPRDANTPVDFSNPQYYRDLSRPIGALSQKQRDLLKEKYESMMDGEKYHHGTHYSSALTTLFYLSRLEPYQAMHVALHGGHFDVADRQFRSVAAAWRSCMEQTSDVKELIPEFFYLPELFESERSFGVCQDGTTVRQVELPAWASSPQDFIRQHRAALESDYVSQHLHHWIDLIFGYQQKGDAAAEAFNVFHPLTYEYGVDVDAIQDLDLRNAMAAQIIHFGQTPSQLLVTPHPKRGQGRSDLISMIKSSMYTFIVPVQASPIVALYSLDACTVLAPLVPGALCFDDSFSTLPAKTILGERLMTLDASRTVQSYRWHAHQEGGSTSPMNIELDESVPAYYSHFGHTTRQEQFAVASNGKHLIACGHDDLTVKCTLISNGRLLQSFTAHQTLVTCLALSEDERYLLTGSEEGGVKLFEIQQHPWKIITRPVASFNRHRRSIVSLAILKHEDIGVSISADRKVYLFSLLDESFVRTLSPALGQTTGDVSQYIPVKVVISLQGDIVVQYVHHNQWYFAKYNVSGRCVLMSQIHSSNILKDWKVDRKGVCIVSVDSNGVVVFTKMDTFKTMKTVNTQVPIECICFSAAEQCLLGGLKDGRLMILATPKES